MYTLRFTAAFKKSYKRLMKRGLDLALLDDVIERLRRGEELEARYRVHKLTGAFRGFHECHIKPDWLLIYLVEDDVLTLTLVETGSHADVLNI